MFSLFLSLRLWIVLLYISTSATINGMGANGIHNSNFPQVAELSLGLEENPRAADGMAVAAYRNGKLVGRGSREASRFLFVRVP
jgi:hypothetical protein